MLINHAYYAVKPILPLRLRLALRRLRARSIQKRCGSYWPIFEASGRSPEGWPGWPDKKKFAFVLTHDVEGPIGLSRCRQLAEIEMEYGFRSSFNFIPNGEYRVPNDLLVWLRQNGFEIGIHDYRHDGTLFRSRETFQRDAQAINRQFETWGAVGFRAGFMLHELDWLHDLDIAYDSSTFDVDPFEPQPDGAQTVFPFWVKKPDPSDDSLRTGSAGGGETLADTGHSETTPSQQGYIELPYTLIQDYNHFVVLQKTGIDIWRRKLSWLVEKGAMAMLDSHPDYMTMPGQAPTVQEFPGQYYRDLLDHVRTKYAGRYWAALPRDVAAYCKPFRPQQARPPRRIVMLTYSFYSSDNRVRRYAETLARRGDQVCVFSLGSEEQVRSGQWETLNGVKVRHIQSRSRNETGKWSYASRLARFFFRALKNLGPKNLPGGCDLLHVHNIPDFLVFAGLRLKWHGTPIILDIHDIVPELYESKFNARHWSILAAGLRLIEKCSCGFADHVIIANHIWKETLLGRSVTPEKLTALVNNVDLDLFMPQARTRTDDRIVLLYPGSLNYHQGLDIAIDAVKKLVDEIPKLELHIYGTGPTLPALKEQAKRLGIEQHVLFLPGVTLEKIPSIMANADIGLVPKRAEGFGDQAYSTKIMEFMSQKLPVVLSRTRIDSLYFNDSVVAFFKSGDADDLARAIRKVAGDPLYRSELAARGFAYAKANSWETMRNVYLDVVDRLTMTAEPID
jgi:glycosyltransferase involved in cell wall biosynthesis